MSTHRFIFEVAPELAALLGDLSDLDAGVALEYALAVLVEPQHERGGGTLRRVRVLLPLLGLVLALARRLRLKCNASV